jgi:hypothetical protein
MEHLLLLRGFEPGTASQEHNPDHGDHEHMPEDGFEKRAPGLAGIDKNVIPEGPWP